MTEILTLHNGTTVLQEQVPRLDLEAFRRRVIDAPRAGRRIAALFGHPRDDDRIDLFVVSAVDDDGSL